MDDWSVQALSKVLSLMPPRLRRQMDAVASQTESPGHWEGAPVFDAAVLTTPAQACRDSELLRFDYTAREAGVTHRRVEPLRLVSLGRRWYLVAWDRDRMDWRSFRLDRISEPEPTGQRFPARELPARSRSPSSAGASTACPSGTPYALAWRSSPTPSPGRSAAGAPSPRTATDACWSECRRPRLAGDGARRRGRSSWSSLRPSWPRGSPRWESGSPGPAPDDRRPADRAIRCSAPNTGHAPSYAARHARTRARPARPVERLLRGVRRAHRRARIRPSPAGG